MKGISSSDGKLTGNVQTVGRYEESKKPKSKPAEEPSGGGDEIHQVVAEHGPAQSHMIQKTGEGFHSTTHHGEHGHVHHKDHASLDEAYEHGKVAMEDAEHNTMGEDAALDAGERGGPEMPSHKSHAPFMT